MSVTSLYGEVSPGTARKLHEFDKAVIAAIAQAKAAKVPQGLLVALLHAHAHEQTQQIIGDAK
jgi:hypothetical protein